MSKGFDFESAKIVIGFLEKNTNSKVKKRLAILLFGQIFATILDIIGILMFGLLGSLVISGVNFKEPQGNLLKLLELFRLDGQKLQIQAMVIAIIAIALLILRSSLSIYIYSTTSRQLSKATALFTEKFVMRLLQQDLTVINKFRKQEWLIGCTKAAYTILVKIPISIMTILVESALLTIIIALLLFVQPLMALITLFVYGLAAMGIQKYSQYSINKLSERELKAEVNTNQGIMEMLEGYSDLTVNGRIRPFIQKFTFDREIQLMVQARLLIYPLSSKYTFEAIIILGSFLISAFSFVLFDAVKAASIISIFLISSSRIGPSVLRLQQAISLTRSTSSQVKLFLALDRSLLMLEEITANVFDPSVEKCKIVIRDISVTYDGINRALFVPELSFEPGERVAIVGPSGGGKSTLIKIISGLIVPQTGTAEIGSLSAFENRRVQKISVGYVPQDVTLFNGTLRDNLLLGREKISDTELLAILGKVDLFDISSSASILDRKVDDFSAQLSGGQRQKLGIARALLNSPKILILDEFTSALDANNETLVIELLDRLGPETIVLAISHRFTTIQYFPRVLYLREGKIIHDGNLENMEKSLVNTL
jgi:ABC-type multidrug transport system fused ATPase/permease subunit